MRSFALVLLLTLHTNAIESQTRKEKKELKAQEQEVQFEKMQKLLNSEAYEFNADWATSFQGRRVNLVTNPNHMKIDKGRAKIYLPYYGVAHTSSLAFTNDGGIVFEGGLEGYTIKVNEKKKEITVTFRCRAKRELLDFVLTVYGSGGSRLNANSSIRTSMKYEGHVTSLESQQP